jgi:arginase
LAVKITRQSKNIVLMGAATSAAALSAGLERSAAALRTAGLADRLKSAGLQVADHGDTASYVFQPDSDHPRARNVPAILKALNDLRPRVEVAVKSGALPLILAGDCISVLAVIAGARRYYRNVSLIYVDRDADLNVPATTPSGCIDGMVISQVIGRGAPELVRFWGEPPLVREPDIALFGFERLDAPEMQQLVASPLRRHPALEVSTVGGAVAAGLALERVHAAKHEFVLHFDVDVINSDEFPWTNYPGTGGLSLAETRDALRIFAAQPNLAAFVVAGYNPELDADGAGARKLIDLLADVLSSRLEPASEATATPADPAAKSSAAATPSPLVLPEVPLHEPDSTTGRAAEPESPAQTESSEMSEPDSTSS